VGDLNGDSRFDHFDIGTLKQILAAGRVTAAAIVESDYIPVTPRTTHSSQSGFGWLTGSIAAADRVTLADGGGISPTAIRYAGKSIEILPGMQLRARTYSPSHPHFLGDASQAFYWSGLVEFELPSNLPPLSITEIHYNPLDPTAEELMVLSDAEGSDFEFLEVQNLSGRPLDLGGYTLTGGVEFSFPALTLGVGERAIIAGRADALALRFPEGTTAIGEFSGNLSNGGERLQLIAPDGTTILDFTYNDSAPWPVEADGEGPSLELIAPQSTPSSDYSNAEWWQASLVAGGSPSDVSGAAAAANEIGGLAASLSAPVDLEVMNRHDVVFALGVEQQFPADAVDHLIADSDSAGDWLLEEPREHLAWDGMNLAEDLAESIALERLGG
jgi:hypothetical protein